MLPKTNLLLQQILQMPDAILLLQAGVEALKVEAPNRQEFLAYTPEEGTAEFVNGNLILHPTEDEVHIRVDSNLRSQLTTFLMENNIGVVPDNKTIVQLSRNNYRPDLCFYSTEKAAKFTDKQAVFPIPDFVVEIVSKSTWDNDYKIKFNDYAAHGIEEYWIIDTERQSIEQYRLVEGEYKLYQKLAKKGILRPLPIKGFEANVAAIFE